MQRIALFLSTSGHSGVDRSMALLIPELCQRGYRVDLLKVRRHGPNLDFKHPNYRVIDTGTRHTALTTGAITRYLKQYQPKALLADKDRCNRIAIKAAKRAKVATKVVLSSGTIMSENLKNRSWLEVQQHHRSFKKLYPLAHSIITPSIEAADDLAEVANLARDTIKVVPLPIITDEILNQSYEAVDHPWLTQKDQPVLVSVGELSPRKDQTTLLKAFAIARQNQAMRLIIVGKGKDLEALQQLANDLNITDAVDFMGFQTNPYTFMRAADLLVHTATFEGFGMVLVEAMALGTAVVATRCSGGPPEILREGKLGLLSPVADEQALANNILQSLSTPVADQAALIEASQAYTVAASTDAYLAAMGLAEVASA